MGHGARLPNAPHRKEALGQLLTQPRDEKVGRLDGRCVPHVVAGPKRTLELVQLGLGEQLVEIVRLCRLLLDHVGLGPRGFDAEPGLADPGCGKVFALEVADLAGDNLGHLGWI